MNIKDSIHTWYWLELWGPGCPFFSIIWIYELLVTSLISLCLSYIRNDPAFTKTRLHYYPTIRIVNIKYAHKNERLKKTKKNNEMQIIQTKALYEKLHEQENYPIPSIPKSLLHVLKSTSTITKKLAKTCLSTLPTQTPIHIIIHVKCACTHILH